MTDERIEGIGNEAKGEVKEAWGKATGDKSTEISGKGDQLKGNIQEKIGSAKEDLDDAADRTR